MHQAIAAFGLLVMVFIAWLLSSNRRLFPWRIVISGLVLQVVLCQLILGTSTGQIIFTAIGDFFTQLLSFVDAGCKFVFGDKYTDYYFAFRVLPTIIFFSSLMSVLYHLGIMQLIVRGLGVVMQWSLKTSGAESLSAAANIFVGQTEAPLVVLPYLPKMTRSELMAIMIGGFATVAGGVMAAYVGMGISAGHLVTASVISAPAGLLIAKVMEPETETPETAGNTRHELPRLTTNVIEAATVGASEGLKLALNVGAMMIAFLALIAMFDYFLEATSLKLQNLAGVKDPAGLTFSKACGYLFSPLAWLMGIEWNECMRSGELLGLKTIANEFVAYQRLSDWQKSADPAMHLSERTQAILTFALCGFSNLASIGIQVGGIGGLVPERRKELSELGLRAMIGGALACFMTACVAGIVLG
ncbi:MAG: NupC/NupG family nucleoside CNT transporter [Planctomyces sp.]|nr:NupC/NupG family nucleoside CNT transporter [Planctomyces sp.]